VSVVVPVRDEERHLRAAVEAILAQEYPGPFEVCLAVAPSRDRTEQVAAELAAAHPEVRLVPNPSGRTPAGLNAAIRATTGEVVVRVDGHAALSPGYVRRAVETLRRTGAVNVGGVQRAEGTTPFEEAVALALRSPFGMGGARFHTGGAEGPVDTVYLGVFRRDALERAGLYDEDLIRNQDYELNIRLRQAGGVVWFDPELWVTYRPRSTWRALARQYFEYGAWKRRVLRMHPGSLRLRQVAPPLATLAVLGGLAAAPLTRRALAVPAAYAGGVAVVACATARGRPALAGRLAVVLPTMHLSWGAGFWLGRRHERHRAG
jgi:glycosyltransferase involved in cell wall biosynthesis